MKYALYYYDACPFCQRVLMALPGVKVDVEKRDVLSNRAYRDQQYKATGKTQVPCLLIEDGDSQQWMFESADIVKYLKSL